MKRILRPLWIAILGMMITAFACVTIHIYFPAEKVESVAGEIVDDIRGHKSGEKDKTSRINRDFLFRGTVLALLPSPAWAEEATTVSNPKIRGLKDEMKRRYAQMKPYYEKGILKEGDDGLVLPGSTEGLGLREKRDLKNLVDAENKNRKTLYKEVAVALNIETTPENIDKIAKIFATEWKASVRK